MKTCARCGYANPDTAALCEDCHKALSAPGSAVAPPSGMSGQPQEPVSMPRPSFWTPLRLYLLGIGLGLIPLALWLAAWSAGIFCCPASGPGLDLSAQALQLYVLQVVAALVCLCSRRTRHVGYGLLTMVLVDPVVGTIGCSVIASRAR
jgi:hypothetical protein